jgi:hypothetical protein
MLRPPLIDYGRVSRGTIVEEKALRTAPPRCTAETMKAERWTCLDAAIRMPADDAGFIDLRPDQHGAGDPEARRLAIGRLQKLERRGLAAAAGPSQWMVGLDAERTLRDLGMRATSSRPCIALSSGASSAPGCTTS